MNNEEKDDQPLLKKDSSTQPTTKTKSSSKSKKTAPPNQPSKEGKPTLGQLFAEENNELKWFKIDLTENICAFKAHCGDSS